MVLYRYQRRKDDEIIQVRQLGYFIQVRQHFPNNLLLAMLNSFYPEALTTCQGFIFIDTLI